ncbi:MAG: beta-propeller fold lactonase family protein [Thermoguttaceae bacterium]
MNSDAATLSVVDGDAGRKVAEIPLGNDPRSLCLDRHGRMLFTANMLDDTVSVVDVESLQVVATIDVADEPYGIVADSVSDEIYLTCAGAGRLVVIDVDLRRVVRQMSLAANPRGLAVSADGKRLYVTHFDSGDVSVVDRAKLELITTVATGRTNNLVQSIVIHPWGDRAYLPHSRSNVTTPRRWFDTQVLPVVSVIDLRTHQAMRRQILGLDAIDRPVCMPFAAAVSPDGRHLYVVNAGSDDLSVIDLYTGLGVGHLDVGHNPRGIVLTPDGETAYVSNHVSNDVSVIDLASLTVRKTIQVTEDLRPADLKRGQILFFSAARPEMSLDRWMSCASCHFDGHTDGRTWQTPRGPRNTPSFRGIRDTHPLQWSGGLVNVQAVDGFIRYNMGGSGLAPDELDDLAAFVNSLQLPPNANLAPDGSLRGEATAGKAIFHSARARCTACHPAPLYTDRRRHDVGTGNNPREKAGPKFDTPSLRGLDKSAPYLHDGSAPTIRDVFTIENPNDRHGATSHLSRQEVAQLVQFLRSL